MRLLTRGTRTHGLEAGEQGRHCCVAPALQLPRQLLPAVAPLQHPLLLLLKLPQKASAGLTLYSCALLQTAMRPRWLLLLSPVLCATLKPGCNAAAVADERNCSAVPAEAIPTRLRLPRVLSACCFAYS
jgi:hypothetical protein